MCLVYKLCGPSHLIKHFRPSLGVFICASRCASHCRSHNHYDLLRATEGPRTLQFKFELYFDFNFLTFSPTETGVLAGFGPLSGMYFCLLLLIFCKPTETGADALWFGTGYYE